MTEERSEAVRLLIVEDDEDLGEMLAMVLRRRGLEVRVVSTGFEALEAVQTVRPDVALIDLHLPDMSGCDVARALRAVGIAMVAHTGDGRDVQRRRTREAGFVAHVVKPARPAELGDLLTSLAAERLARRESPCPSGLEVRSRGDHVAA